MFDVVPAETIPALLAENIAFIAASGPNERELEQLDTDLLAEGSYLIVSLLYLTEVGGAVWPADKTDRVYEFDTRHKLRGLQEDLLAAVAQRTDPLEILKQLDVIYWQTEGYRSPPQEGHFELRDDLVDQTLALMDQD